ncbi:thiol reductase thioredoxin [Nonlabens sp. MB-3u-79]|uniref:thioredoxin family protein n=1 Tax=Nonlabens sp. MB-3u-79 TaxID=2058134 RepID=UPI000C30CCD6|nr:thioredoxin domain-containing protein [Nonlabens sp. MB-3u-79]AUC80147.1 thiol reductase thioredoxin [Nonlabens sp. MB-3u-79]
MKYLFAAFICLMQVAQAQTEITDIDAESKLLVNNDKLIVVDFYATWCGPCKIMDPILKELSKEYAGKVDFYKIDVDENAVDDALGVTAMPTYFFIKNSTNLDVVKGAMSKGDMTSLIEKYVDYNTEDDVVVEEVVESTETSYTDASRYDAAAYHNTKDELDRSYKIWTNSSQLNTLAWHIYEKHYQRTDFYKGIDMVKRSIELEQNYYNLDTLAALLFKVERFSEALKKAKEAIEQAKRDGVAYDSTTELINKIIDKM